MTATLQTVDPVTLRIWLERDDVVLIDIREPDEHARIHIPQAQLIPLSGLAPHSIAQHTRSTVVFHCHSGRRTQQARAQLESLGIEQLYHLEGGLSAWESANLPIRKSNMATMSIARQVQVTVGALMLLGVVLGYLVAPAFLLLSAAVGAGLLVAGLTGSCMLATVLGHAPWNRPRPALTASVSAA